jgi:hypothetical protein
VTLEEKQQRYLELMHAMQTGVGYDIEAEPLSPRYLPQEIHRAIKHLRVGINSALLQQAAISELLVAKGIITHDEYLDKLIEKVEQEVASYEQRLSERFGSSIKLG